MNNCTSCGSAVNARRKYCDDCRDTAAPWRVNEPAVGMALDILDINVPVEVKRSSGRQTKGRYHGIILLPNAITDPAEVLRTADAVLGTMMCHRITVSARMSPEDASRTIWHELTHAKQNESDPLYSRKYDQYIATLGYDLVPYELEAKANERYHDTKFSLTLANKRANMPATKHPHHRVASVVNGSIIDGQYATMYRQQNLNKIRQAEVQLGRA